MSNGGLFTFLIRLSLVATGLIVLGALFATRAASFSMKKDFSSGKKTVCLNEIIAAENLPGREAEKLERYCRIELQQNATTVTAKEAELHAWAAGVIPEKILGSQVVITRSATAQPEKKNAADATQKIRRGTTLKLVLKSANMQIARDVAVLSDAFPGEVVDVRISGTRKNLRARLVDGATAEMVGP